MLASGMAACVRSDNHIIDVFPNVSFTRKHSVLGPFLDTASDVDPHWMSTVASNIAYICTLEVLALAKRLKKIYRDGLGRRGVHTFTR